MKLKYKPQQCDSGRNFFILFFYFFWDFYVFVKLTQQKVRILNMIEKRIYKKTIDNIKNHQSMIIYLILLGSHRIR